MKSLTRDQLQSRKKKAVRFVRDVLGDPERAEEVEDESLEDYADRRKITIANPFRREEEMSRPQTKAELEDQIAELQQENQELQDRLDAVADLVNDDEDDDEDETGDDVEDDDGEDDAQD